MIDLATITTSKWRRVDDGLEPAVSVIGFAWLLLCCLLFDVTNSWLPGIASIALLVIILFWVYRWYRHRLFWQYKLFFVPFDEAAQVVGNVLRAKGIPFRQVDHLPGLKAHIIFELENDELAVEVSGRHVNDQRMAHVLIRPTSRDSRLLAQSLQEKIDEAFLPQGLAR